MAKNANYNQLTQSVDTIKRDGPALWLRLLPAGYHGNVAMQHHRGTSGIVGRWDVACSRLVKVRVKAVLWKRTGSLCYTLFVFHKITQTQRAASTVFYSLGRQKMSSLLVFPSDFPTSHLMIKKKKQ